MLDELPAIESKKSRKTVLVAPTWGSNGLLVRYGAACIWPLLQDSYDVILRPHPQSYVSEPEIMEKIENDLKGYANLTIDRSTSGERSMITSDILISDLSGIIFDYAFLLSKPVIVLDCTIERGGYEAEYVEREIWEISAREKVGRLINENDLAVLPSIVYEALLSHTTSEIELFRKQSLYNFGKAGACAASQLIDLLRGQSIEPKTGNAVLAK